MKINSSTYNNEILKEYFFSFSNVFLRMCLNFIAIPSLSETPEILAIYSIVISLSFFFRYADFGLVAGGKKYAAENVTSKNIFLQLKFLGNSFSVTFLISTLISIVLIFLSLNPEILISSLKTEKQFSNVASVLSES